MPASSSGMGTGTNGPQKPPKWKAPKKGTKTVSAVKPRKKGKK